MFTGRTRCDLLDDKKANRALLGLFQVLLIHVVFVLDQADGLSFSSHSLNYDLLIVALLQIHFHLALVWHVLTETMGASHSLLRVCRVALSLASFVPMGKR